MSEENPAFVLWSLYNERSHIQIDYLSAEQAWKMIAAEDPKTRGYWMLWHTGTTRWKPVADFESANDYIRQVSKLPFTYPAVPDEDDRLRAEEERRIGQFDLHDPAVSIGIESSSVQDSREHRRFKQQYRVDIEIKGQKFTTYTVDISLGGMRLEDKLPPTNISSFLARLEQESGANIYVKCVFSDPQGLRRDRIRFVLDDAKTAVLRTWLLEHPLAEDE